MIDALDDSNVMYFDNDEQFYNFSVIPAFRIFDTGKVINGIPLYGQTFDLTPAYQKCVADGKKIAIKDEKSQIFKNKCVTFRGMTKPIDNLVQWWDFEYD